VGRELPQGADTRLAQGPGEEQDRGGSGRPLSVWLILALVLTVALVAAFSIEALNDYVAVRSESRVLMMDLEDDGTEQHLALHEAFFKAEVTPEIREVMDNERREIGGWLSELERMNPGNAEVSGLREAYDAFEAAGQDVLRLVEAGSIEEAMVLDQERLDPAFEELDERIDAASAAFEGSARRAGLIADLGTYATTLLGAVVLAAAFQRYRRNLQSKQDALERSEARFRHRALHDPLTGLPNRDFFSDRIRHALERARRSGKAVAVLFMDLDNFKYVNDSLGHETGDELLVKVARRIERSLRAGDTPARFGGDEFIVLLEDIAGAEDAIRAAERIANELRDPLVLVGQEVSVGASIGIAVSRPADVGGSGTLLRDADAAMYAAKQDGKATYRVFDPSMNKEARVRLRLENDLRAALESGEFAIHYQPKVELKTGRIVGFEALVRWHHPTRGLVYPDHFISIAEETGLISPIGRWVLERACRQAKGWHETHPDLPPLTLAVNLSPRQFRRPDLVEDVEEVLRETGLDPGALELEITEGVAMEDAPSTLITLYKLKGLGAKLSIDDFGTGYSSLSYLKRFPVDYLKLDRSIVEGLDQDPRNNAVASAVIVLAHSLGQRVIAEGVETEEQLGRLRLLECDIAQGYLFADPVPNEAAVALFEETLEGKPPRWATHRRGPG
jgi:diguanylate cyclase (GGDEF)-like protein